MNDIDEYFRQVERRRLGTRDEIFARVFHLDGAARQHALAITPRLRDDILDLLEQLDFAVRVRNPGVHYVKRSAFLGYRREGESATQVGARSQIFLSIAPQNKMLRLVFVPPADSPLSREKERIHERGHHGVGTHRYAIANEDDLFSFLNAFESLLTSALDEWPPDRRPCF